MRHASALALTALLGASTIGCDEKLRDVAGPTPNLTATFSSIQREIFNTADSSGRAACTQCHNAQGALFAARLNLSEGVSYAALVGMPSSDKAGAVRVRPGDPDNSYLVQKLEGAAGIVGDRMPRTGGPFLTAGQMLVIRRWIQLGANND
jgi:hypothetical protein